MPAYLLAIESSCDETAAAVIDRELRMLLQHCDAAGGTARPIWRGGPGDRLASACPADNSRHRRSARAAGIGLHDLTAVAVTSRPGLVGSLLVGLTAAKTLAMTLGIPLLDVNHVEAHIYACRLAAGPEIFPCVGLVVSGGHTLLYDCVSPVDLRLFGSTIDDAAGEAFDKGAKILGLGYPGGPAIDRAGAAGNSQAVRLPRPMLDSDSLDFSFSGLKTALLYEVNGPPGRSSTRSVERRH